MFIFSPFYYAINKCINIFSYASFFKNECLELKNKARLFNQVKLLHSTKHIYLPHFKWACYGLTVMYTIFENRGLNAVDEITTRLSNNDQKILEDLFFLHLQGQDVKAHVPTLVISADQILKISSNEDFSNLFKDSFLAEVKHIAFKFNTGPYCHLFLVTINQDNTYNFFDASSTEIRNFNSETLKLYINNYASRNGIVKFSAFNVETMYKASMEKIKNRNFDFELCTSIEQVEYFREKFNIPVDKETSSCSNGLHHACKLGGIELLEYFLNEGVNPNFQNKKGDAPLHFAVRYAHSEIGNVLIKNGANVNTQNNEGDTPLHFAVKWNNTHFIEYLLQNNADKDI